MKYNRQALIAATEKAIKAEEAAWLRNQAESVRQATVQLNKWTEQHAANWAAAAKKISAAIRKGQPITSASLPVDKYGAVALYKGTAPVEYEGKRFVPPAFYISLLAVLTALADDEVTSTALTELGIDTKGIGHLSEYLTPGSVRR